MNDGPWSHFLPNVVIAPEAAKSRLNIVAAILNIMLWVCSHYPTRQIAAYVANWQAANLYSQG